MAHLLERAAYLVHGVPQVGEAVAKGGGGAGVGAVVGFAGDAGDVGGHAVGLGEAYGYGDPSQRAGILLDGIGVAREGGVAKIRVEGGSATCSEEGGAGRIGGCGVVGVDYDCTDDGGSGDMVDCGCEEEEEGEEMGALGFHG